MTEACLKKVVGNLLMGHMRQKEDKKQSSIKSSIGHILLELLETNGLCPCLLSGTGFT